MAAAMLDLMGYDVVLLRYSDHMALGIEMAKFSPFYADYPPKYYEYEGKRYYYVETTNYLQIVRIVEDESDNATATATVSPERWGRPWSIGRTSGTSLASVQKEKPEITASATSLGRTTIRQLGADPPRARCRVVWMALAAPR